MLVSNPVHLNQNGCHYNMAVFLEKSVFGDGVWCSHSEREVSVLFMVVMFMCRWIWQLCNIFLNSSAIISVA